MPGFLKYIEVLNTKPIGGLYLPGKKSGPEQACVACAVCDASHIL